jgi:hypothetical protein
MITMSSGKAPDKPVGVDPSEADSKPILPVRSMDDSDVGWGERPERDDDDERFRRDRPPHWESV